MLKFGYQRLTRPGQEPSSSSESRSEEGDLFDMPELSESELSDSPAQTSESKARFASFTETQPVQQVDPLGIDQP